MKLKSLWSCMIFTSGVVIALANVASAQDINGTDLDDVLVGNGDGTITARAGNDDITVSNGTYRVLGNGGSDTINIQSGATGEFYGQYGSDEIIVSSSERIDRASGGAGADTFRLRVSAKGFFQGNSGSDRFISTSEEDEITIDGGAGNDRFWLLGNFAFTNPISGGTFLGGKGNDRFVVNIFGSNKIIDGSEGADTIELARTQYNSSRVIGGSGNDKIIIRDPSGNEDNLKVTPPSAYDLEVEGGRDADSLIVKASFPGLIEFVDFSSDDLIVIDDLEGFKGKISRKSRDKTCIELQRFFGNRFLGTRGEICFRGQEGGPVVSVSFVCDRLEGGLEIVGNRCAFN